MSLGRSVVPWIVALIGMVPAWAQAPAARVVPPAGFDLSLWAREPMLRSPVALSFDDQGRVYVVETARRGTFGAHLALAPAAGDQAGANHIDTNFRPERAGQRLGQRDQRGLRRQIWI